MPHRLTRRKVLLAGGALAVTSGGPLGRYGFGKASRVFPIFTATHPNLTIAALAIRLGETLAREPA